MTGADGRRSDLLDRLSDHLLAEGMGGASLRPLARAAGTSDRMLLYYFADKDALIAAALDRLATRLTALLDAHRAPGPTARTVVERRLAEVLLGDALWPYLRLWIELAALAPRDPGLRAVAAAIGRRFLDWGAAQLDDPNPAAAARLLVMIEGLALLKAIGLETVGEMALTAP